MESLLPIIIQVVAGVAGGGGIASVLKGASMGGTGNMIAGALGGLGGGSILSASGAGGITAATGDATAAASGLDIGGLVSGALGGGAGGAIVTGLVGTIMNKMRG